MRRWFPLLVRIFIIFLSAVLFTLFLCIVAYIIGMAIIKSIVWLLEKMLEWCSG